MPINCSTEEKTVEGIMGVISGVTDSVARGYIATTAVEAATSSQTESITGKTLPASMVVISPEGRARLAQVSTEPLTAEQLEQQEHQVKDLLASKSANQTPSINLGYALFNDPQTNWDARTFSPLLKMTADPTQASMDSFAAALHQVITDGQVGRNQYDNSDTSEAMALTLTQAKLHKLVEKYVSPDNQQQATDIVDAMIDDKIAFREERTLLSAQGMLDVANQYGTRAMQADARDYLEQVKSGTARPQLELVAMMAATTLSKNMEAAFIAFADVINNTPNPDKMAQSSIESGLKQLDVYRQQWDDFYKKLAE
ncbi:hypothetical protein [Erwinia rhapontici]|uniref:hypothetical protein n=1 Tax=Erwinia rhapontici TaxID=55212 RepID=UPI001FCC1043|nr:hypothetical protein [Erwinia rhapontici]